MLCGIICYAFTWTECFFVSDKEYIVYKLVLYLQITKRCTLLLWYIFRISEKESVSFRVFAYRYSKAVPAHFMLERNGFVLFVKRFRKNQLLFVVYFFQQFVNGSLKLCIFTLYNCFRWVENIYVRFELFVFKIASVRQLVTDDRYSIHQWICQQYSCLTYLLKM